MAAVSVKKLFNRPVLAGLYVIIIFYLIGPLHGTEREGVWISGVALAVIYAVFAVQSIRAFWAHIRGDSHQSDEAKK